MICCIISPTLLQSVQILSSSFDRSHGFSCKHIVFNIALTTNSQGVRPGQRGIHSRGHFRPIHRLGNSMHKKSPHKADNVRTRSVMLKKTPGRNLFTANFCSIFRYFPPCNSGRVTGCIAEERWSNQPSTRHSPPNQQLRRVMFMLEDFCWV